MIEYREEQFILIFKHSSIIHHKIYAQFHNIYKITSVETPTFGCEKQENMQIKNEENPNLKDFKQNQLLFQNDSIIRFGSVRIQENIDNTIFHEVLFKQKDINYKVENNVPLLGWKEHPKMNKKQHLFYKFFPNVSTVATDSAEQSNIHKQLNDCHTIPSSNQTADLDLGTSKSVQYSSDLNTYLTLKNFDFNQQILQKSLINCLNKNKPLKIPPSHQERLRLSHYNNKTVPYKINKSSSLNKQNECNSSLSFSNQTKLQINLTKFNRKSQKQNKENIQSEYDVPYDQQINRSSHIKNIIPYNYEGQFSSIPSHQYQKKKISPHFRNDHIQAHKLGCELDGGLGLGAGTKKHMEEFQNPLNWSIARNNTPLVPINYTQNDRKFYTSFNNRNKRMGEHFTVSTSTSREQDQSSGNCLMSKRHKELTFLLSPNDEESNRLSEKLDITPNNYHEINKIKPIKNIQLEIPFSEHVQMARNNSTRNSTTLLSPMCTPQQRQSFQSINQVMLISNENQQYFSLFIIIAELRSIHQSIQ